MKRSTIKEFLQTKPTGKGIKTDSGIERICFCFSPNTESAVEISSRSISFFKKFLFHLYLASLDASHAFLKLGMKSDWMES